MELYNLTYSQGVYRYVHVCVREHGYEWLRHVNLFPTFLTVCEVIFYLI